MRLRPFLSLPLFLSLAACGPDRGVGFGDPDAQSDAARTEAGLDGAFDGASDARGDVLRDAQPVDVPFTVDDVVLNPDSACASASATVAVERLPVDIVWVVDNSSSMNNTIAEVRSGLNYFACRVAVGPAVAGVPDPCASGSAPAGTVPVLDYRVVMLSQKGTAGSTNGVCIPPPLAGDATCGDGPRFHHANINIRSTQTLEQFLGTLGQPDTFAETNGYQPNQTRGEVRDPMLPAWGTFLRMNATRTVVLVSDDDSRLTADLFERFPGGAYAGTAGSPAFTGAELPPGVLDARRRGMFTGYTFNAIFNYGTTAGTPCQTAGHFGSVYDTLTTRTHGARARICDGHAAWQPFLDAVASAVERSSRVACDVAVPPVPSGQALDPTRVNVALRGATRSLLGRVQNMSSCNATTGGWYFDNNDNPTRVFLCPASCTRAQTELRTNGSGVEVLFGCSSIPG